MRTITLSLFILSCTAWMTPYASAALSSAQMDCLQQALNMNVSDQDAVDLCSRTICPVSLICFKIAVSENLNQITHANAIKLCRGSQSSQPAQCFHDAINLQNLSENEAVKLCQTPCSDEAFSF